MTSDGWAKRNWHWLLLAGLAGYFVLDTLILRGSLIFVPRERDPRLVGRWLGAWSGPSGPVGPNPRTLVFLADGTWHDLRGAVPRRRAWWGTKDGRLHLKWLATDAYIGKSFPYQISPDGRTLSLSRESRYPRLFPQTLRRNP